MGHTKQVPSDVGGFSPVFDRVAQDHGLVTAAVFGAIWRHCQMDDKVCKASLDTIGKLLGIDKATVQRHADKLVSSGYLNDLTPTLKNKPHIYADTGKAKIKISVIADVADRNAESESVAQGNASVADSNASVAESRLNRQYKRLKKNIVNTPPPPPPPPAVEIFRSKALAYPDKAQWPAIVEGVGDKPADLMRWSQTVEAYILCGWNKRNVFAMLDWFSRGEIPHTGNGRKVQQERSSILPENAMTPEEAVRKFDPRV